MRAPLQSKHKHSGLVKMRKTCKAPPNPRIWLSRPTACSLPLTCAAVREQFTEAEIPHRLQRVPNKSVRVPRGAQGSACLRAEVLETFSTQSSLWGVADTCPGSPFCPDEAGAVVRWGPSSSASPSLHLSPTQEQQKEDALRTLRVCG